MVLLEVQNFRNYVITCEFDVINDLEHVGDHTAEVYDVCEHVSHTDFKYISVKMHVKS